MLGTNLSTTRQLPVRVPSHVHEQLEHLRQQHPLRTRRHLLHFQRRDRGHLLGREHRWAVDGDRHGVLRHGGRLGAGWTSSHEKAAGDIASFVLEHAQDGVPIRLIERDDAGAAVEGWLQVAWLSSSAAWSRPISSTTAVSGTGIPTSHMACSSTSRSVISRGAPRRSSISIQGRRSRSLHPPPRVRVRHPTEVCVLRSPRVDSRSCVRRPCFSSSWGVSGRSRRVAVAATVRQRPRRRYNQRLDSRNSSPGFVRVLCESRSRLAMGVEWGVDFWSVRGWSRPLSTWLTAPPGSI